MKTTGYRLCKCIKDTLIFAYFPKSKYADEYVKPGIYHALEQGEILLVKTIRFDHKTAGGFACLVLIIHANGCGHTRFAASEFVPFEEICLDP